MTNPLMILTLLTFAEVGIPPFWCINIWFLLLSKKFLLQTSSAHKLYKYTIV